MPTTTQTKPLKPSDVPLAPGVDLDALLKGDDDPLELVVSITPTSQAETRLLERLLERGANGRLGGGRGHQKADEVGHAWLDTAIHYVGARREGDTFHFRAAIDPNQGDLKRWIRAGRVHFEGFSAGAALSLDVLSLDRARNTSTQTVTFDNGSAVGKPAESANDNTDTKANDNAEGEMANSSALGLEVVRRSIVPANQRDGVYVRPIGYGDATTEQDASTITNEIMSGMTVRRRSL